MKLAGTLLLCLLIVGSLASAANAALAGSYRCIGRNDNNDYFLEINHHNPNGIVQNIKRVRAFDAAGTLFGDTGPITIGVPAHGSFAFFVFLITPVPGVVPVLASDISVLVNWAQAADLAAPISRANHYFVSSSGDASMSHAPCP